MWCDTSGHDKFANATALDISETGVRLKVPEALTVQSCVTLRSENLKLQGQASVRYCSRIGTNYAVGLEFGRGVRWSPAAK
jgi:PilZ domain